MHRYLAFLCSVEDSESTRALQKMEHDLLHAGSGWQVAYKTNGALVVHTGLRDGTADAHPLRGNAGVVLGTLFARGGNYVRPVFDCVETSKLIESGGQHLVDQYWGKYFSLMRNHASPGHQVLRDPSGQMPCFLTQWKGVSLFFSHIEDCVQFVPMRFTINTRQLIAHLLSGSKVTRATGLNEVENVPGGERQSVVRGSVTRSVLWHPQRFCHEAPLEDENMAATQLRDAVQNAVSAYASRHTRILHRLSGGLDSSIVAGCLAQAPTRPNVTCFNAFVSPHDQQMPLMFTTMSKRYQDKLARIGGHGDERQFAKLVAARWEFELFEQERSASAFDLGQVWNAPLAPLPSRYVQYIDQDLAEMPIVAERQITGVTNGFSGDELLYTTLQSLGALDYAYCHGIGPRFLTEVSNAIRLSGEHSWLVLYETLKHGLLRRPRPAPFNHLSTPQLMADEVIASISKTDLLYPWEEDLRGLAPGKMAHIRGLSSAMLYSSHQFHRERMADTILALSAQPIAELCMRIPVYVLLAGGVTRGLARKAFADLLPTEIRKRTVKGYTFSFINQLVRARMPLIRESLLDGQLVRLGILDRRKLEAYLTLDQPFLTVSGTQILLYLGAEAWLRQWSLVAQRAAAPITPALAAVSQVG